MPMLFFLFFLVIRNPIQSVFPGGVGDVLETSASLKAIYSQVIKCWLVRCKQKYFYNFCEISSLLCPLFIPASWNGKGHVMVRVHAFILDYEAEGCISDRMQNTGSAHYGATIPVTDCFYVKECNYLLLKLGFLVLPDIYYEIVFLSPTISST